MLEYIQTESGYKKDMVLKQLCRLMKPIITTSVERHLSFIPKYEREDYYQIGYITLWKILERLRETMNFDATEKFDELMGTLDVNEDDEE